MGDRRCVSVPRCSAGRGTVRPAHAPASHPAARTGTEVVLKVRPFFPRNHHYCLHALDRVAWDRYLTAKHNGLDVPIPAQERAMLLDWLAERFGPTTKPFPRGYVPP